MLCYGHQTANEEKQLLHRDVSQIWTSILKNGLEKERREELIVKYPPFSNCPLTEPPKLNPEVKASITKGTSERDARLVNVKQRICAAVSALGSALRIPLSDTTANGTQLIQLTSDAARLMTYIHHEQSQTRRSMPKGVLNKETAETLTESTVDGWLFGTDLTERIKAAKALEKSINASSPKVHRYTYKGRSSLNSKRLPRRSWQSAGQGGQNALKQLHSNQANKRFSQTSRATSSNRKDAYQRR
ncbi:hypothetical protein Zmor_006137 [Zophobas morio]|uniref:Uncharacterized protein n=1 Tax=Zophobas morio TaxID=2755281 RepID=A0AA38IX12_9CUCU|nr:hypothetical protein Zmor_006137 [Zophobas morio]